MEKQAKQKEKNIVYKNITDLKPYKKNAKKHPKEQVERIANSIKEFGFTQPVLIDKSNCVVAGHGRVLGAKKAGLKQVPTICLEDLTPEQIKAYRLADNKLNESEWNYDLLDEEIQELLEQDIDMSLFGFDVDLTDEVKQNVEAQKVEFEINGRTKVIVEFENRKAAEKMYKRLVSEGYICKMN